MSTTATAAAATADTGTVRGSADAGGGVEHHQAVIVGSGFAGIGASISLAEEGIDHVVLERGADVGGTWRDNTYPGCRCDVPSHLYSFSFAPNPEWSETYSPQPEILAYLRRIAEQYGVTSRVRFGHEVLSARWDTDEQRWNVDTSAGPMTADVLLLGSGFLSEPALPNLPGFDRFEGLSFHSAHWPADVDLRGHRVAVIGTGASAIQFVPVIREEAEQVTVFQRTPPWVTPHRNRPITDLERALYRRVPAAQKAVRGLVYSAREMFVSGMLRNGKGLDKLEKLARRHLNAKITDPVLRAKLTPDYRPGCKRLLPSNDWYPALQEANVEVVTDAITGITPTGVRTADGIEHEVDTIVFGTGFRVTDHPIAGKIVGADGRTLGEHWADTGMRAYLGTTVAGFPNLFMMAGPNTGIGHTSLVVMIEAQLRYVVGALRTMRSRDLASVDVRPEAMDRYNAEVQEKAATTVWNVGGCASWYLDSEGRNTTLWPDYTFRFRRLTRTFDPTAYELVPARRRVRDALTAR